MTKFLHLKLLNFLSYKTLDISLEDIAYASVVGENGAGKSTIPQGIAWLLYGSSRFGNNKDSVVNDSAKTASGSLKLSDTAGNVWRIERSWTTGKGGGGSLALWYQDASNPDGWTQFNSKLQLDAQNEINKIIGLSRDAFYSLVIMDQSAYPGGTAFTATDSNKRREILTGLVPELAIWKELESSTRANLKEANKEYDGIQSKINLNIDQINKSKDREESIKIILEDLDEKEILKEQTEAQNTITELNRAIGAATAGESGAIESKIETAKSNHKLVISELNSRATKIDEKLADNNDRQTTRQKAVSKRDDYAQTIADIVGEEDDLVSALNETKSSITEELDIVERIEPKIKTAERRITEARSKKSELDERLAALGDGHGDGACWVCGSELSEEKHSNIVSAAVAERDSVMEDIADIGTELEVLQDKLTNARAEISQNNTLLSRQNSKIESNNRTKEESQRLISLTEETIAELTAKILSQEEEDRLDKELTEIDAEIEKRRDEFEKVTLKVLREQLESVKNDNNTDDLKDQLDAVETKLDEVKFRHTKLERNRSSLDEAQRNTAELNKENKRLNREAQEKKEQVDRLTKLAHATSAKGIPSILLDSILEAIEDEQNRILSSLSGANEMTVEFSQERENKNSGSKEVLDIIVHTSDGKSRLYESFSFGERVRLSISNLFAMIKVFNERSGGVVSTLFLDEPLGPLDKKKIPAFIDILRVAMNEGLVDSIFVITHDDRVIEALPQQISVSMDPDTKLSSMEVS
jgi:DNA repair exonuclease SbcCD ATPase subunit